MYITKDRRLKPRVDCNYPLVVEGTNGNGKRFQNQAQLVNLSASGLYMAVNRNIVVGTKVTVTIHLVDTTDCPDAPKLAANGIVVRSEAHGSGGFGIAIKFHNYRFI